MNYFFQISFLVLCILGMVNAGYLFWKNRQPKPLVCLFNQNCDKVIKSRWSHIFYFRNEALGFVFFLFMFFAMISTFFVSFPGLVYLLILIGTSFSLLFSIFLIFVQIFAIKEYCFYCLLSALITLLLFLNSLVFIKEFYSPIVPI